MLFSCTVHKQTRTHLGISSYWEVYLKPKANIKYPQILPPLPPQLPGLNFWAEEDYPVKHRPEKTHGILQVCPGLERQLTTGMFFPKMSKLNRKKKNSGMLKPGLREIEKRNFFSTTLWNKEPTGPALGDSRFGAVFWTVCMNDVLWPCSPSTGNCTVAYQELADELWDGEG